MVISKNDVLHHDQLAQAVTALHRALVWRPSETINENQQIYVAAEER